MTDKSADQLLHEAVEAVCGLNPRLIAMPYDQMKAAALALAEQLLTAQKVIDAARLFCESTLAEMGDVEGSDSMSIPAEFMSLHYAVRELEASRGHWGYSKAMAEIRKPRRCLVRDCGAVIFFGDYYAGCREEIAALQMISEHELSKREWKRFCNEPNVHKGAK